MNTTTAPAANILTAREFIAQGTTAGAIISIAQSLESKAYNHRPQRALAERVRVVAKEVAAITGQTLVPPAAVTNAREFARYKKRHANDNRVAVRRAA